MNEEHLTDEMVTEMREGIKKLAEAKEEETAGQARLDVMERGLKRLMDEMAAKMLGKEVEVERRKVEAGPQLCGQCGERMRNVKGTEVWVQSVFGAVRVKRTQYYCERCRRSVYPLDQHCGWEEHRFTSTAKEWICLMTKSLAYEGAEDTLERVSGIRGSIEAFRDVTQECGGEMRRQREVQVKRVNAGMAVKGGERPQSPWMLVGVDGCRVLQSGEGVGKRKKSKSTSMGRSRAQKRKARRRQRQMIPVVQEPEPRGMEAKVAVVGTLVRKDGGTEYQIEKKTYVGSFEDVERFTDWVYFESAQRGVLEAERIVVMGDGADWIWKRIAPLYPKAKVLEILDWYHLKEKVGDTAEALFGSRVSWTAKNWMQVQLDRLWLADADSVLDALSYQRKKREQSSAQSSKLALQAIGKLQAYLQTNRSRINYPQYCKMGLPIGTGDVESGCKVVVAQRMKQSGMQWRRNSAAPVLHLRAEYKSRRWDENWQHLRRAA